MPPVSQAQRRLMYAAAAKPAGAGGVSRKVAKDFVAADKPGKLPPRKKAPAKGATKTSGKPPPRQRVAPGLINSTEY
jgi:hypothetical protein